MFLAIVFIIAAVVFLYFGAELALSASEVIGNKLRLPPLVIGMVLIGLGTSLPELFVAHIAALEGKTAIAAGTLVGSNIANMLLILGLGGLFMRLSLASKSIRSQLIIHLILSIALVFIFNRGAIDLVSSVILLTICAVYIYFIFKDIKSYKVEIPKDESKMLFIILKLILGFSMLYVGGELLVKGGVDLCMQLGVSEYIVSSIFIAFGTSFPELVTVLLSIYKRKDTDLIIGNIVGSNLFNCSLILDTLGPYHYTFDANFTFESIGLVFGASFLAFGSIIKRDFFRTSAFIFLVMYTLVILSWVGIIDRSHLWI